MSLVRDRTYAWLVDLLWREIPLRRQDELWPVIDERGACWAVPSPHHRKRWDLDDYLTVEEVAAELGVGLSAVRNWSKRHGFTAVDGKYRWGDVCSFQIRRRTNRKNEEGNA